MKIQTVLLLAITVLASNECFGQGRFFWSDRDIGEGAIPADFEFEVAAGRPQTLFLYYQAEGQNINEGFDLGFSWSDSSVVFTAADSFDFDVLLNKIPIGVRWGDIFGPALEVTPHSVDGLLAVNVISGEGLQATNDGSSGFVDGGYDISSDSFQVARIELEANSNGTSKLIYDKTLVVDQGVELDVEFHALTVTSRVPRLFWSDRDIGQGAQPGDLNLELIAGQSRKLFLYYEAVGQDISDGFEIDFEVSEKGVVRFLDAETFDFDVLFGGTPIGPRWGDFAGPAAMVEPDLITGFTAINVISGEGLIEANDGSGDFFDTGYDFDSASFQLGSITIQASAQGSSTIAPLEALIVNQGEEVSTEFEQLNIDVTQPRFFWSAQNIGQGVVAGDLEMKITEPTMLYLYFEGGGPDIRDRLSFDFSFDEAGVVEFLDAETFDYTVHENDNPIGQRWSDVFGPADQIAPDFVAGFTAATSENGLGLIATHTGDPILDDGYDADSNSFQIGSILVTPNRFGIVTLQVDEFEITDQGQEYFPVFRELTINVPQPRLFWSDRDIGAGPIPGNFSTTLNGPQKLFLYYDARGNDISDGFSFDLSFADSGICEFVDAETFDFDIQLKNEPLGMRWADVFGAPQQINSQSVIGLAAANQSNGLGIQTQFNGALGTLDQGNDTQSGAFQIATVTVSSLSTGTTDVVFDDVSIENDGLQVTPEFFDLTLTTPDSGFFWSTLGIDQIPVPGDIQIDVGIGDTQEIFLYYNPIGLDITHGLLFEFALADSGIIEFIDAATFDFSITENDLPIGVRWGDSFGPALVTPDEIFGFFALNEGTGTGLLASNNGSGPVLDTGVAVESGVFQIGSITINALEIGTTEIAVADFVVVNEGFEIQPTFSDLVVNVDVDCDESVGAFDDWQNSQQIILNRLPMTISGPVQTNRQATVQDGEQFLENTGSTAWYYFVATEDGTFSVSTVGSDFDTQLHIFTGSDLGFENLSLIANNNDIGGTKQSSVSFDVLAGERYEIRVGGAGRQGNSDEGCIVLRLDSSDCPFILGDINCDGVVDLLDIEPFAHLIINDEYLPQADVNFDGVVNILDISPFVDILTKG